VIAQIRALATETRAVALAGISTEDQARLVDVLTRIRANLSAKPADSANGEPRKRASGDA
jgi:hypothetical protein